MTENTRPTPGLINGRVTGPTSGADVAAVTAQQLGCLRAIVEQLFTELRHDLASVSEPLRSVERSVSVAEQKYRDCLEVYGAAFTAAAPPAEQGPAMPTPPADLDTRIREWAPRAAVVRLTPVNIGAPVPYRRFHVDIRDSTGSPMCGSAIVWGSRKLIADAIRAEFPEARWDRALEYHVGRPGLPGVLVHQTVAPSHGLPVVGVDAVTAALEPASAAFDLPAAPGVGGEALRDSPTQDDLDDAAARDGNDWDGGDDYQADQAAEFAYDQGDPAAGGAE